MAAAYLLRFKLLFYQVVVMSFFSELKRRNVIKVIALYVITGWVILQAADLLSDILPVPEWTETLVFLLLILAFPLVVGFSWVYEITPEGIKRETEVAPDQSITHRTGRRLEILIGVVAAVAIIVVVADRLVPERPAVLESEVSRESAEITQTVAEASIAVLPFDDMSEAGDQAYFSDGLAEELLNLLAKLPELNVASRTSSFVYRDAGIGVPAIAENLGVRYILEGSVRKQGERIRVTAQLIDGETNFHEWSETYEREQDDIFEIQDDIARKVVTALHLVISSQSEIILTQQSTDDIRAFEAYLRGKDFLRMPSSAETLDSAEEFFQRAIDIDDRYGDAYAGLCDTHRERFGMTFDPDAFEAAELVCNRALTISPREPAVMISLGQLYRLSDELERSEENFLRAIEFDDQNADAYDGLARTYERQNRLEDARIAFERAIEVQPGSWRAHNSMGGFLFRIGRSDEAISFLREAVDLSPNNARALGSYGAVLVMVGEFEQAREVWYRSLQIEPTAITYSNLGTASFFMQDFEQAAAMYMRAIELTPNDYQLWGSLGDAYRFTPGAESDSVSSYSKAIELAEAHLQLNVNDAYTLAAAGFYLAAVDRADQAERRVALATELAPEDMYIQYFAALAAAAMGDNNGALEAARRAVENGYPVTLLKADAGLQTLADSPAFQELVDTD
jgi:TolB-like protein/Tfp pilus assembly protein PilF